MAINTGWHKAHRMPKNLTIAQRIRWHQEHQKQCACRPIPKKLLAQMKARPGPVSLRAGRGPR